jgi:hypothetical protein
VLFDDEDVLELEEVSDDEDAGVVDEDGRFELTFTVPEDASRGTHSINVEGEDDDGLPAHCALTVRVNEHPDEAETETSDTTEPTTGTSRSSSTSSSAPTTTSSSRP